MSVLQPACPTDDTLVAFAQRALTPAEREGVASHLDDCESCRILVRAGAMGSPPPTLDHAEAGDRPLPIQIGARINSRYEVRRLLGVGGMGHVFAAHDTELDREVALKVLRPELAGKAAVLAERLVRESRLTAKIAHPAVMTVYDIGRSDDTVFIAMELIRGETLGVYIARIGASWRTIVALYERAAAGLAAAHAAGIVHRDFKPENVLVETDASRVIVTDFGIARASESDDAGSAGPTRDVRMTATGLAIGTPAYMAPEQLDGASVDQRADVFAFAVSLWEAIFGERPFPGRTIAEIREAMTRRPKPTRVVPRRLVRALERGLEMSANARWHDLQSFVRELAAVRGRRRRIELAAGGIGLVGVGIAGSLALSHPNLEHPCAQALAQFNYDHAALAHALAPSPEVSAKLMPLFDGLAARWRVMHVATCVAARAPAQDPNVAACLDARRIEFEGVVADLTLDGPGHAVVLSPLVSMPEACTRPPPAALFSRVPESPALRRKVTALRDRAFDAEALRNRGDMAGAIKAEQQVIVDAANVWPPLEAETLYLLGATQAMGADAKAAVETLHKAAALAEASHHDYIAVSAWTQLVTSATFDDGDPKRGLEYATYAEGALLRLAYPPEPTALLEYAKGTTLVELHRLDDAEKSLQHSVALCKQWHLPYLPVATQGLAYLYEQRGRYADAVATYRTALAGLSAGPSDATSRIAFDGQLSVNLDALGQTEEAVAVAREGKDLADVSLGEDSEDRLEAHSAYAMALGNAGQYEIALAEIRDNGKKMAKLVGEREERYAEILATEGQLYMNLGRYEESNKAIARACDVIAFRSGDNSGQEADCRENEVTTLEGLGKHREALALVEKLLPILVTAHGNEHPTVVTALGERGEIRGRLGDTAGAITDLESALATNEKHPDDPGKHGALQLALAEVIYASDPNRAKQLLHEAIAAFGDSRVFQRDRAEAGVLLATGRLAHPHPIL